MHVFSCFDVLTSICLSFDVLSHGSIIVYCCTLVVTVSNSADPYQIEVRASALFAGIL